MPIYDYLCTACDHRADILHGINDPAPNFCPSCGAEGTMRKQFSAPTIHFKGSGWAKKDRGGSSAGTKAPSSKHTDATGDSSSSGSGESSSSASSSPSSPSSANQD
jgi:putative FmdB family regulatory protein